jgi:excisionase family DNA binding protein
MGTIRPEVTGPANGPLVVRPAQACWLLGVGNTKLYELIAAGELESYLDGRSRRITMASIRARIARLLAADTLPRATPRRRSRKRRSQKLETS